MDDLLSRCIVAYIGNVPFDSFNHDQVAAIAGSQAGSVIEQIESMLAEVYDADPPLYASDSLQGMGDAVDSFIAARHPAISPEARKAIANRFTFDWR